MKNKFFVIQTFSIVILLFFLLALFNYKFDSYGFFQKNNTLDIAAKAVANGKTIIGLSDYDERLFQKKVFENFEKKPQCIAIGSSRSMMIESKMIKCEGLFFNHSVSGASLEDYIAILGLYDKNHTLPRKVILGLDPWIFNQNNNQTRWISLKSSYIDMYSKISNKKVSIDSSNEKNKYFQLINYENTKNNIKNLKRFSKNKQVIKIIKNENIDAMIKRSDGSIIYPFKTRYQDDSTTLKNAKNYTVGEIYSIENFNHLENTYLFEGMINYLLKNNVEILFFLPPYHPNVYKYLSTHQKYKYVFLAEKYVRDFSKKNKIKIVGSYNPNLYNFGSKDFTDGMHGKSNISQILLKENNFNCITINNDIVDK